MKAVIRLSVYTNAEVLLPRFDEEEFLTEMFVAGPPKVILLVLSKDCALIIIKPMLLLNQHFPP